MIRTTVRVTILAGLMALSGCVFAKTTDGTGLEGMPIDEIQPGISTRADVTRIMGPPDEVIYSNLEHDRLFEQAYRYRRTKTKQTALFLLVYSTFNSDRKWDHLMVFFDENGVVEHLGVRLNANDAEYGSPY